MRRFAAWWKSGGLKNFSNIMGKRREIGEFSSRIIPFVGLFFQNE